MALKRRPPAFNFRRAKSNGKNSWGVTTNQLIESVQFESDLARRLLYELSRKPGVVRIVSEPMAIPFQDFTGKKRTYIPDYKVIFDDGVVEIHEFSMASARLRREIRERERGAQEYLQKLGWKYFVHTEQDLPSLTEYANLRAIRKYGPTAYYDPTIADAVMTLLLLCAGSKVNICALAAEVSAKMQVPKPWVYSLIWHLVWHNRIACDLNILLFVEGEPNPAAVVWLTQSRDNSNRKEN